MRRQIKGTDIKEYSIILGEKKRKEKKRQDKTRQDKTNRRDWHELGHEVWKKMASVTRSSKTSIQQIIIIIIIEWSKILVSH